MKLINELEAVAREAEKGFEVSLNQITTIRVRTKDILKLCAAVREASDHLELALTFAPKGPVPEGLLPTSYHTLNYADEVKLQARIDAAREALKKLRGENE